MTAQTTKLARRAASRPPDTSRAAMRQAVVTSIENNTTCTLTIGGGTRSGVRWLDTYTPVAGDSVFVVQWESDLLVLGPVGAGGLDPFTALPLNNGWANLGGTHEVAGCHRDATRYVHLQGMLSGGTQTAGTVLATLPAGFRPRAAHRFIQATGGSAVAQIDVKPDGTVSTLLALTSAAVSLAGITFRAYQ